MFVSFLDGVGSALGSSVLTHLPGDAEAGAEPNLPVLTCDLFSVSYAIPEPSNPRGRLGKGHGGDCRPWNNGAFKNGPRKPRHPIYG